MLPRTILARAAFALATASAAAPSQAPTAAEIRLERTGLSVGDEFGADGGTVGDWDGDGASDVVTVAPYDDSAGLNFGAVYVLSGRTGAVLWTLFGTAALRPAAASRAGDVNADGAEDLLIGFPADGSSGLGPGGSARVYSGATGAVIHVFGGSIAGDGFGFTGDAVGDVDGDGHADVAVGTARFSSASLAGYVRVYSGATGALLWQRNGLHAGERLGYSLASAGDVDGNGVPDVVAGAIGHNLFGTNTGAVRVFDGLTGATIRNFTATGGGHRLGFSVDGLGDLNGDGKAEIVAGTFRNNGPGYAHVYDGATGAVLFSPTHPTSADHFGHTVCGAGDWNGDGVPDFAVGATDASVGGVVDSGFVRVFSGSGGSLIREFVGVAHQKIGFHLSRAGDVNGDGLADLKVGSISNTALVGRVQILSRVAADRYGVLPSGQLLLGFSAGGAAAPSNGALHCSGGSPFAAGLLAVGSASGSTTALGVELLLDLDPNLWFVLPAGLDGAGAFAVPVDLLTPGLGGIPIFTQFLASDPSGSHGLIASNGVRLLFGA